MAEMSQAEINNKLFKEIQLLKDLHEVQEVMSWYFHLHLAAGYSAECWERLFSHKAPDVSVEIANWGRWEGQEAVRRFYCEQFGGDSSGMEGMMFLHELDTPCIQVAGDGKTAKGVWFSPGHETIRMGDELKALMSTLPHQ